MNTNIITRLTVALAATILSAGLAACSADTPATGTKESRRDTEPTTPAPADGPDAGAVAASFVEATFAYDLDRAVAMLGPDVEIPDSADVAEWLDGLAWNEALGFSLADLSCQEESTSSAGTEVLCTYAVNALGSEQLGRGPYGDNTADITVLDGKITRFEETWPYMANGFSAEMWEPFEAWIRAEHPASARLMYDVDTVSEAEHEKELRLWEKRIPEYVAAQQ